MKTKIYNLIILDKSGSMNSIANAAIAGVNETIGSMKASAIKHEETQEHFFSLMAFCNCERKYIFENAPISDVRMVSAEDYQPCCGTPLYDAIGLSVNRLANAIEKEENAIAQVTIITDGYENSSCEYSRQGVKALIERFKKKGWTFAFIGANQDVEAVAYSLSISNSMKFTADEDKTRGMFCCFSVANDRWASKVEKLVMKEGCCCDMEEVGSDFFTAEEKENNI